MVRPRRNRWVSQEPDVDYFKPQGVAMRGLERVELNVEEFEALRLRDHDGLDQNSAAARMKISQPTFCRVYKSARAKVVRALVEGLAIKIHGGVYKMPNGDRTGPEGKGPLTGRGRGPCGTGRGMGRGYGRGMGLRTGVQTQISKEEERKALEIEREQIEKRLQELNE